MKKLELRRIGNHVSLSQTKKGKKVRQPKKEKS